MSIVPLSHRLCLRCWKASKRDHTDATCVRCFEAGKAAGRQNASVALDKTRLRELLQLSHPDKHNGSPLAQRITQWLNEQRSAAR